MGCLKLTYEQNFPLLKVTHSDFLAKEKNVKRFFISEEKSSAGVYRYSFNGMEKDDEVKGNGNHLDFGARCFDSRLGRFLSIDAHAKNYPAISPYVFVGNGPLNAIDPDGNDIIVLFASDAAGTAGHGAVLIGSEKEGWSLYSKNGTTQNFGFKGPSDNHPENNIVYNSINEFANSIPFTGKY